MEIRVLELIAFEYDLVERFGDVQSVNTTRYSDNKAGLQSNIYIRQLHWSEVLLVRSH